MRYPIFCLRNVIIRGVACCYFRCRSQMRWHFIFIFHLTGIDEDDPLLHNVPKSSFLVMCDTGFLDIFPTVAPPAVNDHHPVWYVIQWWFWFCIHQPRTDVRQPFVQQFKCIVQRLSQPNGGCSLFSGTISHILIEFKPEWELPYYSWPPHFLIIYRDSPLQYSLAIEVTRVASRHLTTSRDIIDEKKWKQKEGKGTRTSTSTYTISYCYCAVQNIDMILICGSSCALWKQLPLM